MGTESCSGLKEDGGLLVSRKPEGTSWFFQVGFWVAGGHGGEPGVKGEPVGGSTFELGYRGGVRGGWIQGEPVSNSLSLASSAWVKIPSALLPVLFQGLVDGGAVPEGPSGNLCQGNP